MIQFISAYLALPVTKFSPAEVERVRGIRTVAVSLSVVSTLGLLYELMVLQPTTWLSWLTLFAVVGFLLTGLLTLIALHERRPTFAASLLVVGSVLSALAFAFPYELNTASSLIYVVPLIMAGVILSRIGLVATFVALSIGATFQHFLHLLDIVPLEPYVTLDNRDSVPLATVILGMLVSIGILTAVENRQRSVISRLIVESRNLRTLTEFSATIVAINDDSRLLNEAADQIRDQFGYYYVQVFLVEPQAGLIVRQALNQVGHVLRVQQRIPQTDPTNVVALAMRTAQVQQIALGDPPERRTEFLPATQSETLIPLAAGGRVYGVLDVHSIQPNPLGAFDLEALQAVANQLTLAIQNIQRGQMLDSVNKERQRWQEQAARLGRDLERFTDLETNRAWGQYLSNRPDNLIGFDWVDGSAKENLALSDSLLKTYRNAMPQVASIGGEQVLSVPIVSRGQALGVLEFRVPHDRPWDGRSIELARTVAQRLALSLENIRLFEQAQIVANRETTVNQIAARLEAKVTLESLIEEAQQSFAEATGSIKTLVQFIAPQVEAR